MASVAHLMEIKDRKKIKMLAKHEEQHQQNIIKAAAVNIQYYNATERKILNLNDLEDLRAFYTRGQFKIIVKFKIGQKKIPLIVLLSETNRGLCPELTIDNSSYHKQEEEVEA
jgi:hypothetical protein